MSSFGGSRSIADQRVYVQETPPNDRRAGVRWFDTSTDAAVAHVYSVDHSEFMRESRVWVQDVEPEPRVGPLDGDRWVDVSQEKRPTLVYSAAISDWVNPVDVSWSEVSNKPSETGTVGKDGGYGEYFHHVETTQWSVTEVANVFGDGAVIEMETGRYYGADFDIELVFDGKSNETFSFRIENEYTTRTETVTFESGYIQEINAEVDHYENVSSSDDYRVTIDIHEVSLPYHSHSL